MELYCMYSFQSDFCNSALCLWDSSMGLCLSVVHSLFLSSSTPLCECATVRLPMTAVDKHCTLGLFMSKALINILLCIFFDAGTYFCWLCSCKGSGRRIIT